VQEAGVAKLRLSRSRASIMEGSGCGGGGD
jgi:hypothetical protein